MKSAVLCLVTVLCFATIVNSLRIPKNECLKKRCPPGTVCKYRKVHCFRVPCHHIAYCARINLVKPGLCPKRDFTVRCSHECYSDYDCKEDMKCCGCLKCESPVTSTPPPSPPLVKPGRCPASKPPGVCDIKCFNDASCPGIQKCCGLCPRICQYPVGTTTTTRKPVVRKPGRCPRRRLPCQPGARQQCKNDTECPGRKKCCRIACHNQCVYPYPTINPLDN